MQIVRSAYGSVNLERKLTAAMIHLDHKLIFIPLVFILLRFWGTLRFFISFRKSCHTPCDDRLIVTDPCRTALYNPFLMVMQASCDPGQGWGNALVFVIFHKTLLKRLCPCLFYASQRIGDCYHRLRGYRKVSRSSSSGRKDSPLINDDKDEGRYTPLPSDECDKLHGSLRSGSNLTSTHM